MNHLFDPVIIFMILMTNIKNWVECASYTAGVVEFSPEKLQPSESPLNLIMRNAQQYVKIISTAAKHDVDILVFPECGLTTIHIPVVRELIVPYLTEIPEVGSNPCDLLQIPEVLKTLSCAARNSSIYVVINLGELVHCSSEEAGCPADGDLYYNTQIAFSRTGEIVARYRKYNLFIEPEFNITNTPDHSWFDTDFGVRFGMFICFDILFKEPTSGLLSKLNISNFVYSTAWFSEMPFLFAVPVQAAWAYANDANLLSAGYNNPANMNAGSGIYAGRDGPLIVTMPQQPTNKLLIARVSPDQRGITQTPTEEITFTKDHVKELNYFHDNLKNYTSILISDETANLFYENNGFRCNVTVELSLLRDESIYRIVAFSGERSYGVVTTTRIEVCGVVACADSNIASCGTKPSFQPKNVFNSINILAFSDKELLSYPITMTSELIPVFNKAFQFENTKSNNEVELNMYTKTPRNDLITFALYRNG